MSTVHANTADSSAAMKLSENTELNSETSYDDALIRALIAGRSATEAAAGISKSVTTVYRRLRSPLFRARLAEARGEHFRELAASVTSQVTKSLESLIATRDDPLSDPRSRVHAAKLIIDVVLRLRAETFIYPRLAALEAALAERGIPSPTAPLASVEGSEQ